MPMLQAPLSALEKSPVLDTMAKEVIGINLPKVAFTRTQDETVDVAINEFGNTVGFVGAGMGMEALLNEVFNSKLATNLRAKGGDRLWEHLGRSAAIFSAVFAVMWAMPFVRNYFTAWRTGQVDYTDVIGASSVSQPRSPEVQQRLLSYKLTEYKNTILKILGLGALGAAAGVGGSLAAMRAGLKPGAIVQWIGRNLGLAKGAFSDFAGWKALLFWGVPAYGGWIHASRDPYEKKEQVLKFINFVACFIGPQMLMKKLFKAQFAKILPAGVSATFSDISKHLTGPALAKATRLKIFQEVAGLGSSILLLGVSPAVLNIFLTNRRLAHDEALLAARQQQFTGRLSAENEAPGSLQRKSFEQFVTGAGTRFQPTLSR
jgi:hypothetical protein